MTRCSDCENEDREGGQYCEACGARIEPKGAEAPLTLGRLDLDDEGSADVRGPDDAGLAVSMVEDEASTDPADPQDEGQADATDSGGVGVVGSDPQDEGQADAADSGGVGVVGSDPQDEGQADAADAENEGVADSMEAEEESPALPPKVGYLVFPDDTEQPIPPSQWLIGRADLAKYVSDPEKAHEISRGHMTVFQEGEKFFVEDGKTMVQERPSANKTWLVRGGSKILVTGTGRNELLDADEIDVAELVKLQFVAK